MGTSRGTVYYTQHREVTSNKPHYLVVLNCDPDSAQYIVFGVITSNINDAKLRIVHNRQPLETLVFLTPSDYPELNHDSVIDCNSPVKLSKWEFDCAFAQINATRKTDMPDRICNAIVSGALASTMVAQNIKKLLSTPIKSALP